MMLIEVLIGMLVFSIGILSMLGMQTVAMRATIDAKYRAEAGFLANELLGIMWSDPANIAAYAGTGCAGVSRCNAWVTKVQARLPQATGGNAPTIAVTGRAVTIVVKWQSPNDSTASNHTVVAQVYRTAD